MAGDTFQIDLPDRLTIGMVADLKKELHDAIKQYQAIQLNCSQVYQIDTAALQLLLCFQLWAQGQGVTVCLVKVSEEFISNTAILGIDQYLTVEG